MIFLIEYSRGAGQIIELRSFDEADRPRATELRLARELELSRQGIADHEVVLLEAEDETALRKAHARYFSSVEELMRSAISELERSTSR